MPVGYHKGGKVPEAGSVSPHLPVQTRPGLGIILGEEKIMGEVGPNPRRIEVIPATRPVRKAPEPQPTPVRPVREPEKVPA